MDEPYGQPEQGLRPEVQPAMAAAGQSLTDLLPHGVIGKDEDLVLKRKLLVEGGKFGEAKIHERHHRVIFPELTRPQRDPDREDTRARIDGNTSLGSSRLYRRSSNRPMEPRKKSSSSAMSSSSVAL